MKNKKILKLFSVLISSLLIISCFAACGNETIRTDGDAVEVVETSEEKMTEETDGGIKLSPITSEEAKTIFNSFPEFEDLPGYESKSADGKTILVYAKSEDGWYGRSITGALYDAYGKPLYCEHCNKIYGSGKNMCFGECSIALYYNSK